MTTSSQKRTVENHRRRLGLRGMSRFEVRALEADKDLIRALARRLADNDPAAARLRVEIKQQISGTAPKRGGILAALRRSPLVGAGIAFSRDLTAGRAIDL